MPDSLQIDARFQPRHLLPTVLVPLLLATAGLAQPFDAPSTLDTRAGLRQLLSADMDGDGDLDLLGTSVTGDEVFLLRNDGAAWQASALDASPTTTNGAFDVAVGDLDGDGDLDVVASARDAGDLVYWLNDGSASTWTRDAIATTVPGIRGIELGDLDLDGDLDVVAAVTGAGDLRWWEQTAVGWTGRVLEGSATDVRLVQLGDIDRDGDLDVIAAVPGAEVAWWENPRGAATPWTRTSIGATVVVDPGGLVVGDLGPDGAVEILVADQDNDTVLRWKLLGGGTRGGTWKAEIVVGAGEVPSVAALELADLDGDRDLDLLVASSQAGVGRWYPLDSPQDSTFYELPTSTNARLRYVSADTDGDGDADLVAIERPASGDDSVVLLDSLRPHRRPRFRTADGAVSAPLNGADPAFARGDIDGDGAEDLVVVAVDDPSTGTGGAHWLGNPQITSDGAPFFESNPIGASGQLPDSFSLSTGLTVGDFDQDGDNDLLIGEQDSATQFVDFCENLDGEGDDWDCSLRTPTGVNASFFDVVGRMASGDLNGDGLLDFVALTDSYDGSPGYDGLHWFENLGDMSVTAAFEAHQITADPVGLTRLQIIDVDNDGDLDVAGTADLTGGALQFQLFRNDGSGGFGPAYSLLLNDDFRLVDLDRDGVVDLVSVYRGQARIQWFAGTGSTTLFENVPSDIVEFDADTPPQVAKAGGLDLADFDGDGDLDLLSSYQLEEGSAASPGEVFWMENRLGSSGAAAARGATDNTDEDWRFYPITSSTIVPLFALDISGDGKADAHAAQTGIMLSTLDTGGALGVEASDISSGASRGTLTLGAGQVVTPALFVLSHEGIAGDAALDITEQHLQITDDNGDPWTQEQIDELLGTDGAIRLVEQADLRGSERGTIVLAEWSSAPIDFDGFVTLDLDEASGPFSIACCLMTERRVDFVLQVASARSGTVELPAEIHLTWKGNVWTATAGDVPVPDEPVAELSVAYALDLPVIDQDPIFADGFESGDTTLWQ